jgi:hypothetical protein
VVGVFTNEVDEVAQSLYPIGNTDVNDVVVVRRHSRLRAGNISCNAARGGGGCPAGLCDAPDRKTVGWCYRVIYSTED